MSKMRKTGFILSTLLLLAVTAKADDLYLHTWDVTIGKARTATLYIGMDDEVERWHGFSMDISLPAGITMKCDDDGNPIFTMLERMQGRSSGMSNYQETKDLWSFAFTQTTMSGIRVGTDPLFSVTLVAADSVTDGTYTGKISNVVFATLEDQAEYPHDAEFTIIVDHNKLETVTLDETSTTAPTASDGEVNVEVKRTIKGGEWSTICLPFAMTGEQVVDNFGADVRIADFDNYVASDETDDDDNPLSITINFTDLTISEGIEANHPYVIKTSRDITTITVNSVAISPATAVVGKRKTGRFIGTFVADTEVPEEALFISGNQFWYSVGKTKMKAYRAYFDLPDVCSSYYSEGSNAKINFLIDGVSTDIRGITVGTSSDSSIYSVDGRNLGKKEPKSLPKGIYIVNGRKVIVK